MSTNLEPATHKWVLSSTNFMQGKNYIEIDTDNTWNRYVGRMTRAMQEKNAFWHKVAESNSREELEALLKLMQAADSNLQTKRSE